METLIFIAHWILVVGLLYIVGYFNDKVYDIIVQEIFVIGFGLATFSGYLYDFYGTMLRF